MFKLKINQVVRKWSLKQTLVILMEIFSIFLSGVAYSASDQILNSLFFQNPAELSVVHKMQLIGGSLYVVPTFKYTGTSFSKQGKAVSQANDALPYILTSYRFTDQFVLGINITPSGYGHLEWPLDSIVANASTTTKLLYYRAGLQASYQFTDNLALGVGLNLQYNKIAELDSMIPGRGNQINKVSARNYIADAGLFYKINTRNFITAAIYSSVHRPGYGTSTLGSTVVNNLSMTLTDPLVTYVGFQHNITDKWFLEEKLYWSGWALAKNLDMVNTATGSHILPLNWKNAWSIQFTTRYAITEKLALLNSLIYETNPGSFSTNAIGYPLAASGAISAGLDISLIKELSAQIIYSYGGFLQNSPINDINSAGNIKAHFQAAVLQFTYKV